MTWKTASLSVQFLGFLCFQCIFAERQTPKTLWKKYVSDKEAACNDNSRATFYIGPPSSNKWIVFFESGGFCASFEECNLRYINENSTVLMTSALLPDKVTGRDLLSASKIENPAFYDYTHVLVPYCSSDLWLGLKTNPNYPFHFVNDSTVDNFSFRGHAIFRSVFLDLLERYNLSKAEEIVLAGSSAGGIGVMNHADWVLNHVIKTQRLNAKLKAIIDSGWFINFQDSLEARIRPRFTSFANISLLACSDVSLGYTCCPSSSCMIARGYYPASIPLLLISSMYDIFLLEDLFKKLEDQGKTADDNSADYVTFINMYGGSMNESITSSENQASNLSIFVPACFQHIYFSTSSLWGEEGVLHSSNEFGLGKGKLSHKIQSGTWEATMVQTEANTSSMKDFITAWVKSRGSPMTMIDSCLGAQCNPTCPDKLLFLDPATVWKEAVQWIILVLCLVITVVSFGLKTTFVLHHHFLKTKQKQYLDSEDSLAEKEIPHCRPHERISIACLSLSYSVNVTKQKAKREKEDEKPLKINNVPSEGVNRFSVIVEKEEEMSANESQCSVDENKEAFRRSAADHNKLGFDTEAKEGLVTTLQEGISHSPTNVKAGADIGLIKMGNCKNGNVEIGKCLIDPTTKSQEGDNPRLKKILKDVSVYFNPGELVAIMGPSGCGKTTLLDLLTGRRRYGNKKGNVYINGVGLGRVQDWYARKIGYVLQLAVPYYEELTVRQNLFFAAHMRLPKKMSYKGKFERVEQILAETGLTSLADRVVGGSLGTGLSGGQKRRLCVALQMIHLPAVLFLDEPTSGLDASSSLELLNHLNLVSESGRLVILTIHQPRLEIFHLFDKILLLSDGQVAYYGEPTMAPALFLEAYVQSTTEEFRQSEDAPKLDATNPADTIMDLLNFPKARRAILDYYQTSGEPQAVQEAIRTAQRDQALKSFNMATTIKKEKGAGTLNRIFVLEARTTERQTLGQMLYFPFIFFMFGLLVGTAYYRAEEKDGVLLMSAFCIYCCASPLFLSNVLMAHLSKALDIFHLEHADGCGRAHENVIQTFVRFAATCALPVIVCSVMSYFMVMTTYDLWRFVMVTITSLVLNQTWIALYMMVICAQPSIAHRICPMLAGIGGFAGGFIIPLPKMPIGYIFLFYINPQFYGFGAITKVLLNDVHLKCAYDSTLNCISTDGNAVLASFGFDTVNVYENLAILLGITVLSLFLAWLFLEMKYMDINFFSRKSSTFSKGDGEFEASAEKHPAVQPSRRKSTLHIITEDKGLHTVKLHDGKVKDNWENKRKRSSRKERWQSTRQRTQRRKSSIEAEIENVLTTVRRSTNEPQRQSKKYNLLMPTINQLSFQLLGEPDDPSTKNDEQNLSMPRSRISSEPNIHGNQNGHGFHESRVRFNSQGSPSVRFQDESEDGSLQDSISEQGKTCEKNKRWDSEYKESVRQNQSLTNYGNRDNKGNSDEGCVEMKDVAYKEDDNETNNSQDTAF